MNVLAIIPARGQSKRIPRKNLVDLNGIPLIGYSIKAGLESRLINNVLVTTDDEEIAKVSAAFGAQVQYPRPAELSGDHDMLEEVLRYTIKTYQMVSEKPDVIVLLQPTSPFRTAKHIDSAIKLFHRTNADSVTAVRKVTEHPYYLWKPDGEAILPYFSLEEQKASRHKIPPYFIENGSIYVIKSDVLLNVGLYGKKVVPYEMSALESVDIDEPLDLEWAKFLLSQ